MTFSDSHKISKQVKPYAFFLSKAYIIQIPGMWGPD